MLEITQEAIMKYGNGDSMGGMHYGYDQGNMKAHVKDWQKPKSCYSQSYDQKPTKYMERQNRVQIKAASKLRGEEYHMGRYD